MKKQLLFIVILTLFSYAHTLTFHQGEKVKGQKAIKYTTKQLKKNKIALARNRKKYPHPRLDMNRTTCQENPHALKGSTYPAQHLTKATRVARERRIHFFGKKFTAGTLDESNSFPPDSMGVVGPKQFIALINGLLRSFDKTTGLADGVLDINPDQFFLPVNTNPDAFDPRIRYDRFSQRWFMITINRDEDPSNRIMLAVSDGPIITQNTEWNFFFIQAVDGVFFDYPTLGIDAHALYIGGKTFGNTSRGGNPLVREDVYVIRKNSVTGDGPIEFTRFGNLLDFDDLIGPHVTQGVDNFDQDPQFGYFIAVDNFFFSRLVIYKISNPGGTPSISDPIPLDVLSTDFPINVRHRGNTGGSNGRLDGIDDRLMCAHIRNDSLWTAHAIGVNNEGESSDGVTLTRNGVRWYEIDIGASTPTLEQSGTLFHETSSNTTSAKNYWMPSIMTSGQGHMIIGCNVAGSNRRADATVFGRHRSDPAGTLRKGKRYTKTTASYNPPEDTGASRGARRWGDYSYTSLDPEDDMTMWTIQEYCNENNSWGVKAARIKAPRPAYLSNATPSEIPQGQSSINITITGTRGSLQREFFDPGEEFDKHINATIGGGVTVNSVTYVDPLTIILNVSTVGASTGRKRVTVINPDGRTRTRKRLIRVV